MATWNRRSGRSRSLSRCSPRSRSDASGGRSSVELRGGRGGGEDLAAVAGGHDPRRPVDVDPDRTGPGQQCPTGVDPDPDADRGILRPDLFAEQALRRQGAPRASAARSKSTKNESPCVSTSRPVKRAKQRRRELVVQVQDVGVAILEALEESGGALDIREQERDRVTRDGRPPVRVRGSCRRHLGALSHRVGLVPWIDPVAGLCASSVLVTVGLVVGARSRCGATGPGARPGRPRGRGAHRDGPPTRRREGVPAGDARLG